VASLFLFRGVTLMAATPIPSEVIELDVDDPRMAERQRILPR
jgi:hypothetical protein